MIVGEIQTTAHTEIEIPFFDTFLNCKRRTEKRIQRNNNFDQGITSLSPTMSKTAQHRAQNKIPFRNTSNTCIHYYNYCLAVL